MGKRWGQWRHSRGGDGSSLWYLVAAAEAAGLVAVVSWNRRRARLTNDKAKCDNQYVAS